MKKLGIPFIAFLIFAGAGASGRGSLKHGEGAPSIPPADEDCTATLYVNHYNSFENGSSWSAGGIQPPYYGAFAEGFDLGAGYVECGARFLTQVIHPIR